MNPWRNVTLFFMFANFYVNPWYNVTYFLCVWISLRPWSILSLSFYACDFFYQSEPNNNETEKQGTEMKGGVMVSKVTQGSPADKTDLRIHDIITQVRLLSGKTKRKGKKLMTSFLVMKVMTSFLVMKLMTSFLVMKLMISFTVMKLMTSFLWWIWWHHLLLWNWWHHSLWLHHLLWWSWWHYFLKTSFWFTAGFLVRKITKPLI